jgi:hypothetical protein
LARIIYPADLSSELAPNIYRVSNEKRVWRLVVGLQVVRSVMLWYHIIRIQHELIFSYTEQQHLTHTQKQSADSQEQQ